MESKLKQELTEILLSDRNIISVTQCSLRDFCSWHYHRASLKTLCNQSTLLRYMFDDLSEMTYTWLKRKSKSTNYNYDNYDFPSILYLNTLDKFTTALKDIVTVVIKVIPFNKNSKFFKQSGYKMDYNRLCNIDRCIYSIEIFLKENNIFLYHLDRLNNYCCCGFKERYNFLSLDVPCSIVDVTDIFVYKNPPIISLSKVSLLRDIISGEIFEISEIANNSYLET